MPLRIPASGGTRGGTQPGAPAAPASRARPPARPQLPDPSGQSFPSIRYNYIVKYTSLQVPNLESAWWVSAVGVATSLFYCLVALVLGLIYCE